jgi:hypothetical protein
MDDLPLITLSTYQGLVHLDVDYFNEDERAKLLRYPSGQRIEVLVSEGCKVPLAQFLAYYLFYRNRSGSVAYGSYSAIASRSERARSELDGWVTVEDESLVCAPDAVPLDRAVIERIGEAGALCLAGQIHDLHEADWQRIPIRPGPHGMPSFDYQYDQPTASDGTNVIQVEAKGSAVPDTSVLTDSAKKQKTRIDTKKERIRELETKGSYPYPADLRYGILSTIGRKGRLHCWLTDPPADGALDARRYRLLSRMQFMLDIFSVLNSRSPFTASLATRLAALHAMGDPNELDRIPLRRANGEPFEVPPYTRFGTPPSMFARMCRVTDGPAVGTLVRSSNGTLYFAGVQRTLYELAANQDFSTILEYREAGGSAVKRIECVIPKGRAKRMGLADLSDRRGSSSGYVRFFASSLLHYSQGGIVFGVIDPLRSLGRGQE